MCLRSPAKATVITVLLVGVAGVTLIWGLGKRGQLAHWPIAPDDVVEIYASTYNSPLAHADVAPILITNADDIRVVLRWILPCTHTGRFAGSRKDAIADLRLRAADGTVINVIVYWGGKNPTPYSIDGYLFLGPIYEGRDCSLALESDLRRIASHSGRR